MIESDSISEARRLVGRALGLLGVQVTKRLDLSTPAGFDQAVATLGAELRRSTSHLEADALRAALAVLDVNWLSTTAARRRQLVSAALVAAGRKTALIPAQIRAPLGEAAEEVVATTRSHARREQGLAIAADFNAVDRRSISHVVRSQANFVRDEYGRRLKSFGQRARQVVADGLEAGLGRADIAARLRDAARAELVNRAPFYWEIVSGSFVGRGRAYAQASAYAEAGIERYQVVAVLDERTSTCCRYLNGKTFEVRHALDHIAALDKLDDPEVIKATAPWVRRQGNQLYVRHTSGRVVLADVVRDAVGTRDDPGEFRSRVPDDHFPRLGLGFPPYHALCRSTSQPAA